ncbi:hypothetical protein Tco_0507677 [Tanacetum coccineum]
MRTKGSITLQTCELSQEEFNDFLALYPVPSEYHVILPKSNQTVFDAPPGLLEIGSVKLEGGSSRPPVKRKLASGSSTSRVTRAKTSSLKDDALFLKNSNDDEGLPDVLELKDANACHLKIYAITPPSWKNHLDNHIDLELLDLYDRCYSKQLYLASLYEANVLKLSLDRMMEEVRSVEAINRDFDLESSLVGKLVSSAIVYGRCRAFEQVAGMKEPFDCQRLKGYALITEGSLLRDTPTHSNRIALQGTQVLLVSSQRAAPSYVPASNLMSPPADAFVVNPQSSPPQ